MEWALQPGWAIAARTPSKSMDALSGFTDAELVTRARRGHPDAYGELVRRYQTRVFNIAYRLVGNSQDALDLAQDAFVRGYNALDTFDVERPFAPWIYRIVTNLALNWLKHSRTPVVSLAVPTGDAEEWMTPDDSTDPERVYLASERQAQLRRAILALPPHYRAVIELRHFQEQSYEEIGAVLNLPLSDVKSQLFRARQLLRRNL